MRISPAVVGLASVLAGSAPAAADWNVSQTTDVRTNTTHNVATLAASGGAATLRMRCVNGRTWPDLIFSQPIVPPKIVRLRATYQFDSSKPVTRSATVSEKGRELWLWVGEPASTMQRILRARRLLVEVTLPAADEPVSFEFDLTGADRIVPQVQCPPL